MSKKSEYLEALELLREQLTDGCTIWVVQRGRQPNGTSYLDFYRFHSGPEDRAYLTGLVCKVYGLRWNDRRGCASVPFMNMDPAFAIVDALRRKLGFVELKREWL